MIVAIFLFVQDKFDLFNISWKEEGSVEELEGGEENIDANYVEIDTLSGVAVRVDVEIADNDAERSRGLSGRTYLGEFEGMLFIFDSEVDNLFWMKDMKIPLDIIFIDSQDKIVYISKNQQPCTDTFCPSISSDVSFQYVLEINSGFCEKNQIEAGCGMIQYLE